MDGIFSNPVIAGGFVLMLTGAVMAIFRGTPYALWAWLKRQVMVTLDITDDEPIFQWISIWLDQHPYMNKSRLLSVSVVQDRDEQLPRLGARVIFSPAPGNHFITYRKRPVWIQKAREKAEGGWGRRYTETIKIRILSRSQDIIRGFVREVVSCAEQFHSSRLAVFVSQSGYWQRVIGVTERNLDSVVLPGNQVAEIANDVAKFLDSKDLYKTLCVPYRRGLLFWGIPGTGKSSLALALASHFKMPIYILGLGEAKMTDDVLRSLVAMIGKRAVLLIEDVDATVPERNGKKEEGESAGITLSALLNVLDGILAKDGCVSILTTNHVERLDPALIRPGRIDKKIEFTHANVEQIERMYYRFFPDSSASEAHQFIEANLITPITMCRIQELLLEKLSLKS